MSQRALLFGSVAAAYERYRLGYPDTVVDEVLSYAGRPIRSALEIGAGTGKATRAFAARGIAVTATDPDAEMLAELRQQVPYDVVTRVLAFEDLPSTPAFDLVFAAAALHWTNPESRWPRVAAMLSPGGTFASFGGRWRLADPALEDAVRTARSPYLGDDDIPSPDGTPADSPMQWPGTELVRSELFTDVRQVALGQHLTLLAEDYVGYLSTVSAYLQLPAADRADALHRIRQVLPASLEMISDLTLHLARLV